MNNTVEFPSYEKLCKELIFDVVKNEHEFTKPEQPPKLICLICHKGIRKKFKVHDVNISLHKCCYKYLTKKIDDCKQALNNYESKLFQSHCV